MSGKKNKVGDYGTTCLNRWNKDCICVLKIRQIKYIRYYPEDADEDIVIEGLYFLCEAVSVLGKFGVINSASFEQCEIEKISHQIELQPQNLREILDKHDDFSEGTKSWFREQEHLTRKVSARFHWAEDTGEYHAETDDWH
jgi:hypothetical protein